MWLRKLKVRIKEYPKGFVVEIKVYKGIFRGYQWTHLISVSGIDSEPWYYDDLDMAVKEARKLFGWDLLIGKRDYGNE